MTVMQVEVALSVLVDIPDTSEDFQGDAAKAMCHEFITGSKGNYCGCRWVIMSHDVLETAPNPHYDGNQSLFPEVNPKTQGGKNGS